jgi:transcriptional regulator with XRE-family HTH domain
MAQKIVDVEALYAALDHKRDAEGLSWRDLAAKLKVSPSTFTRMAQGRRPDVDAFAVLLQWLGMPMERFLIATKRKPEKADAVAMFSSYLRSDRHVRPEDADALEDILKAAYRRLVRNG